MDGLLFVFAVVSIGSLLNFFALSTFCNQRAQKASLPGAEGSGEFLWQQKHKLALYWRIDWMAPASGNF
jgi:hypothetical protein